MSIHIPIFPLTKSQLGFAMAVIDTTDVLVLLAIAGLSAAYFYWRQKESPPKSGNAPQLASFSLSIK
jgi:hypothetical protein